MNVVAMFYLIPSRHGLAISDNVYAAHTKPVRFRKESLSNVDAEFDVCAKNQMCFVESGIADEVAQGQRESWRRRYYNISASLSSARARSSLPLGRDPQPERRRRGRREEGRYQFPNKPDPYDAHRFPEPRLYVQPDDGHEACDAYGPTQVRAGHQAHLAGQQRGQRAHLDGYNEAKKLVRTFVYNPQTLWG